MNIQKLLFILQNRSFLKSVFSGCITAATDFAFLLLFHEFLGLDKLLAVNISFALAIIINFLLQKFWTFSNKDLKVAHKQFLKFLGLAVVNFFINGAIMFALVSILGIWYIGAQIIVMGGLAIMNFTLYRIFVFK